MIRLGEIQEQPDGGGGGIPPPLYGRGLKVACESP